MSYCLNPACTSPNNLTNPDICQACGSSLLLRDRYRAEKVLGRGGFGTTFLAKDEGLPGQPSCVIKQLRPMVTTEQILEMARELFQREATTLGKIGNHPQVPRLLDYFAAGQEFYLVQEYVEGATLQQEIRRNGPMNEVALKQVLREVLPILDYVHAQGVIHRDIKPANLIRRLIDQKLVLIDFGAVKDQVSQTLLTNPQDNTTLTAFAVGTPGFAPPEQMAMRPIYASDIYALGATCLFLLLGKSPKELDYDPATGELLWREQVQVSEHLANVLAKMLEVSVRHRFQSAQEVLQALEQIPQPPPPVTITPVNTIAPATEVAPDDAARTVSPAARAAVAIREQQARLGMEEALNSAGMVKRSPVAGRGGSHASNINSTSGYNGQRDATLGRRTPWGDKRATPASSSEARPKRLDAAGLQQAYSKGKRDFANYNFNDQNLRKLNLSDAIFHQSSFQNCDLQGATLVNVNLGRASLGKASLRNCNLSNAYLSYADLQEADLRGANLTDAYLNNANLRGANLYGANLTGAIVTDEQLALARTNWHTILPNGRRGAGLW